MNITLKSNVVTTALTIFGGKEEYQNARREYLEFVFPQEGHTVEALEGLFSAENCGTITLTDDKGSQFIHEGYVLRGAARVSCNDGAWEIAIRRYQRTDMEREVAALRENVAALMAKAQK